MSRPFDLPKFWEYSTFDEEKGCINGVREDAPQWAKDEYQEWEKMREEMKKRGRK